MARNMNLSVYDGLIDKAARITDEELANDVVYLKLNELHSFKNHPFKVKDDEEMERLVESIKENGVFNPILVRRVEEGYEVISGHRRIRASELAGKDTIPTIIRKYDDNEATIAMVDSNNQREKILPSERAWSLKMRSDAIKHQGKRSDLTSDTQCPKLSSATVGEEVGLKQTMVKKYIRLTNLIPELLEMVDKNTLNINIAYEIAGFGREIQCFIKEYIYSGNSLKIEQIHTLKENPKLETLSKDDIFEILLNSIEEKKKEKITFTDKKLNRYFDKDMSMKKREEVILKLLKKWKDGEIEL